MKKLLISSLLSIGLTAQASCPKPVTYLPEGTGAPCNGYLFTPEKELEVRTKVIQIDKLKELSEKQDELIDILNQRVDNNQQQISVLKYDAEQRNHIRPWEDAGFFILGILVTGYVLKPH